MDQLIFKFPFSKKYYEQDFYVSSNNFSAYKLVESWPNWPGKWLNIFGSKGSGKTHLAKILEKKIDKIKLIDANNITHGIIQNLFKLDCLIIDNYDNNIDEKLLYSILNQSKQLENYILINSIITMKNIKINLKDLQSRLRSFLFIGANSCTVLSNPSQNFTWSIFVPGRSSLLTNSNNIFSTDKLPCFICFIVSPILATNFYNYIHYYNI